MLMMRAARIMRFTYFDSPSLPVANGVGLMSFLSKIPSIMFVIPFSILLLVVRVVLYILKRCVEPQANLSLPIVQKAHRR